MIDSQITEAVKTAKSSSTIVGIFKYLYYISPVGWMINRPKHEMCRELSRLELIK